MKYKMGIWTGFIILFAIGLIYDYHRPDRIERGYAGIIYSTESGFEKKTVILIRGDLYKNLFGRDVFIGELTVDGDIKHKLKLQDINKTYHGLITAIDFDAGVTKSIGSVMVSRKFDKAWIQLNEINSRYDIVEGYVSGPARTMEEADDLARSLLESM